MSSDRTILTFLCKQGLIIRRSHLWRLVLVFLLLGTPTWTGSFSETSFSNCPISLYNRCFDILVPVVSVAFMNICFSAGHIILAPLLQLVLDASWQQTIQVLLLWKPVFMINSSTVLFFLSFHWRYNGARILRLFVYKPSHLSCPLTWH